MLKGFFNLPLRVIQCLLDSLLKLMNVPLFSRGYACISKRARTVKIPYRQPPKGKVTDLVIDSIGLKVLGQPRHRSSRSLTRNIHEEVLSAQLNPLRRTLGTGLP